MVRYDGDKTRKYLKELVFVDAFTGPHREVRVKRSVLTSQIAFLGLRFPLSSPLTPNIYLVPFTRLLDALPYVRPPVPDH